MGLWSRLTKPSDAPHSQRGILRAALEGATLDHLCQESFWALHPALSGHVECFGVWYSTQLDHGESPHTHSFQGRFWSDGRESDPSEVGFNNLNSPFPKSLLESSSAIEQDFQASAVFVRMEAAAGVRRALWTPIRVADQFAGILFAGTRSASARFPREEIERIAAELALVIDFRLQAAVAKEKAADLAEARKIWLQISAGGSSDDILQQIASSSLRSASNRLRGPNFVALGILSESASHQDSDRPHMDFRWSAGDRVLIRLLSAEPVSSLWRKALETRSTAGSPMPTRQRPDEVSRVVAIPLLISGEAKGVLVAGFDRSSATLAHLERLELRASLAAAAIAISARPDFAGNFAEASDFLLQKISDPVLFLNPRREIVNASHSAKAWLSALAAAFPGHKESDADIHSAHTVAQLFRPADWPRVSAWMDQIAEPAGSSPVLATAAPSITTKLNTGREVQVHAAPLPGGSLAVILYEQVAKEEPASVRAEAELNNVLEWIDQGVVLFDENEILRTMNQRFAQLFGFSPEDVRAATTLRELIGLAAPRVANPAQFADRWWDAARGVEANPHEEVRVLQPSSRILERTSRPVLDSAGVRLGRIEIYRDLTAQQLFQSKLHKSERLAALGQNVSSVAHELSNPLTTILGYAQRLLRGAGDSGHRDDIQRIFSEADRASSILRQLLGSARETSPERRAIDLNAHVLQTIDLQRFQLASEKIRLHLDLAPGLPPILCDSGPLQQILMNLISNARHALLVQKTRAVISVRTRIGESGQVILEISDSGPGIPEADRDRIFDPFFTTKPPGIGTGLGLSIVMGLVRQNGGNIALQSTRGQGATFSIDFPAAESWTPLAPDLPPALSALPRAQASGRVLVVEDEPTVAQLIADMLADLGYSSDVLHDGRRALVSALNREYDLVICDMKMPGLDGRHLYRALAEADSPLTAKFLFVTGDVLGVGTQEFLHSHHCPHIAKPFRLEEFAEKIALVLGNSPAAVPASRITNSLSLKNLRSHG